MGHIVKTDILPLLFRNSAIRWKAAVVFAFLREEVDQFAREL